MPEASQALYLTDDIGADWVLALWAKAPTPADARRLTEKKVARVLATHRIRRIAAADALAIGIDVECRLRRDLRDMGCGDEQVPPL